MAKDIVPGKLESLYEIGYMLIGRKSIYIISLANFVLAFGLMMIYFIVFGDIMGSMMTQLVFDDPKDKGSFVTSRPCYVIMLGILLFPVCIKKEIKELTTTSIILFTGIFSFIFILMA